MHRMHIAGIDLNLAVVLHVLLEERSVSRGARRLGLSQSATSHALARLRALLHDPLFVRTSTGLVPTARAEAMASTLASALSAIEGSFFSAPVFDPATARRTFHVGTSDYAEHVFMPPLLTRLAKQAPNMDVWTRAATEGATTALAQGQLDLVIAPGTAGDRTEGLHTVALWEDHFVFVVRRGHPLTRGKLTVDRFAGARHAFIAPRGRPGGVVDEALAKRGRSRRIAFTTPNFLVAPQVVANTDLVITLASRVATVFAQALPLVLLPPPLELPGFRIAMFWHERRHADPAHQFLREEVTRAARELPASARTGR
ncbi:MAG TPA: LysR family transcriptional regulator [Labilithrix sp.]|nr:LysR family transcriptional regulator [Labilithrix sp.]